MSKRKTEITEDQPIEGLFLDEEQLEALQLVPENLHPNLKCLAPVLETVRNWNLYGDKVPPHTHKRSIPTRQATEFKSTTEAAAALKVDFRDDDPSYVFELNSAEQAEPRDELSPHFAAVINDLKTSEYVGVRHDESFSRTVIDLIIMERLKRLKDQDAGCHLQVSAEVPVSIRIKDIYGNTESIKARADWALGYGPSKSETGAILLVVEAKPLEPAPVGMPQLLVCMAAVQDARPNRINRKSVFGMLTDSHEFRFAYLDQDRKFFRSEWFMWAKRQDKILAYIDMMLISAIESSPQTPPPQRNNRTIYHHSDIEDWEWRFGDEADDETVEEQNEEEDQEDQSWDVVQAGGSA